MTTAAMATGSNGGSAAQQPGGAMRGDVVRVVGEEGGLVGAEPSLTSDEAVSLYRAMLTSRRVDEHAAKLASEARIGMHVGAVGQEATVVGAAFAMEERDWLFPEGREVGAYLLRGMSLRRYFDQLFGNGEDAARGRQSPDQITCREAKVASASAPLGTQIVHAVGFGWAARSRGEDLVALTMFGGAATASADFHNGANFAGVFQAPVIFLCRNDLGAQEGRHSASETLADKAIAYGLPALRCDGSDALAVLQVTRSAIERARRGEGPTVVEALPSGGDPLERLGMYLEAAQGWSPDPAFEEALGREIEAASEAAAAAPSPPPESMMADVFADLPWHLREQRQELLRHRR